MRYETLTYDVEDRILTITLNRPDKLNAFTGQMMNDLIAVFDAADDAVRARSSSPEPAVRSAPAPICRPAPRLSTSRHAPTGLTGAARRWRPTAASTGAMHRCATAAAGSACASSNA